MHNFLGNMGGVTSLREAIVSAEQAWRAADHILSMTFPAVREPKLLLRALEHLEKAARGTISVVLKVEYLQQRVQLSASGGDNLVVFFEQCAPRYGLSLEEARVIRETLALGVRHKASSVEFSQKGKVIMLDDEQGSVAVSPELLTMAAGAVRKLQLALQHELKDEARNI